MRRTVIAFLAAVLVLSPPARHAAAAPADHLAITTSVINMRSGTMFNVEVVARDATGAIDTGFSGTISLDATAVGGSNFPGGTVSVPIRSGRTTVFGLALNNAADGYTLTASAPGLGSGVSNAFNITAQRLVITSAVANMRAGSPFAVQVEARDGTGAVAENFTGNVTLVAGATGGSNFTGGDPVLAATAGIATFNGLTLDDAANNYGIMASATGVSAGFSDTFHVTASHLAVSPVADTRAGDGFAVAVEARDANDDVAENYSGNVLLDAVAAGGSNFAGGTVVSPAVAGAATFGDLTLTNAADGYTLSASAPGLDVAASASFDVTASQLVITTTVADMPAGTPFTLQVEARDADDAVAENFDAQVALDAAAAEGANFDGGTQTTQAGGGGANFPDLVLNSAAEAYTITASAAGVSSGISNSFDVTAADADISIDDVSITEGNSGIRTATFTVSLSRPSAGVVTVAYTIDGASASSGSDFEATSGMLTFEPGVTAQTISVAVNGDLLNEPDETFVVDLTNAVNATIVDAQGVGTIVNDDPLPTLVALPALVAEGSTRPATATVTVRLSTASGQPVSVSFQTADGTAVDGVGETNPDYTATAGTLVFAPGEREQTITTALRNDLVVEADEIFFVDLAAPVNASLATPRTAVVIIDDDAPARQLAALAAQVLDLDLDLFRKATLVGDLRLNCGGMHQFVRDVARYRGAHISDADADALTRAAQRLAVSIRCPI